MALSNILILIAAVSLEVYLEKKRWKFAGT